MKRSYSVTESIGAMMLTILFMAIILFILLWLAENILFTLVFFLVLFAAFMINGRARRARLEKILKDKLSKMNEQKE
jgi:hypothetical protein